MGAGGFGDDMFNRIALGWRVFGTGLGFIVIGIGGVSLFPLLNICIRSPRRRSEVARHAIKITFRFIVGLMRVLGVFRYDVEGLERLTRQGQLILANHPPLIDIVFLMAFVKRADCIVKSGLWRNPFTCAAVQAAGYIRNDDNGARVLEDCVESVRRGNNLIIFPEGTRTRTGRLQLPIIARQDRFSFMPFPGMEAHAVSGHQDIGARRSRKVAALDQHVPRALAVDAPGRLFHVRLRRDGQLGEHCHSGTSFTVFDRHSF